MKTANFPIPMLFFAFFLFTSCGGNRAENRTKDLITNETPDLFQNDEYASDLLGSFSRKRSANVIDKLYKEALENDEQLNSLNERIQNIFHSHSDSLKSFENYSKVNYDYWVSANNLLSTIRDSVLRDEVGEIFSSMQSDYERKTKPFIEKRNLINERSGELGDRKVILKLAISLDMINKYQSNEMPKIKQIDNILTDYDDLIAESKGKVKLEK